MDSLSRDRSPRRRVLLDAGWRFQLHDPPDAGTDVTSYPEISNLAKLKASEVDRESQLEQTRPDPIATLAGEGVSFVQPDFDDSAWRQVDLPHDWAVELPFSQSDDKGHGYKALKGNSVGWYRRRFHVSAADAGQTIRLEFDGVYRNTLVWLNGHILGRNVSGYSSFYFDVSPYVITGGDNILVVRVDASRFEGWFYEGAGIYRHVWLETMNPLHVDHSGTFVSSTVRGIGVDSGTGDEPRRGADIAIQTDIRNDGGSDAEGALISTILDRRGRPVGSAAQPIGVAAGQMITVSQNITLRNVHLWSPESPYLYKVVSTIVSPSASGVAAASATPLRRRSLIDTYETRFGVRTVTFDPSAGFLLNGRRVQLKGVANHQDHAGVGSALPDRLHAFRLERLKAIGVNAVRTAHNPPAPELLDAADRIGILVMDENRRFGRDAETLGELERMIRRDRNHPSVVMWSLANEESLQATEVGADILSAMQSLVHDLDPTRPCTAAMNGAWGNGFSTVIDVQGFNYHEGNMAKYHQSHPDQPSVATEAGSAFATRGIYASSQADSWIDDYGDRKAGWGSIPETMVPFYAANPWNAGSFYWTGFDYRGEPTPYGWPAISSQFGLLDTCGFPKNAAYYLKANWTDELVLHIYPHWNWSDQEGQPIDVRVVGNCGDQVELFLNGESQGVQDLDRMTPLAWSVSYAPGALEARCYAGGQLTASATVATAGDPAAIVLQPDRSAIDADGRDVSMVTVAIVDSSGAIVPTADNLISFSVDGGRILGVGNGNPGSHEPDKAESRSAFNGLAQVIVQSKDRAGEITLTASSPGLSDASTTIQAVR